MQFTNDEITLIKSAALNRYLQLGFTEKDAELLYGNFISNINKSKPKKAQLSKKAQLDEIKSRLSGLYDDSREGLTDLKARLSGLYDSSRERLTDLYENSREGLTDLTDKIPEDYRGALLGGGVGALGGGLAGLLLPNNDAGLPARLARALRWLGMGAAGGAAAGGVGGGLAGLFRPNNDARVRERELDLENALRIELEALNKYIEEHQSR